MTTARDRDIAIRTVIGEAANEGQAGWGAVASVLQNRASDSRWPSTVADVALQNQQFSAWNSGAGGNHLTNKYNPGDDLYERVGQTVDSVFSGQTQDSTGGATHYYSPRGMEMLVNEGSQSNVLPRWLQEENDRRGGQTTNIGGHIFTGQTLGYTPEQRARQEAEGANVVDPNRPYGISDKVDNPSMARLRELSGRTFPSASQGQFTTLDQQPINPMGGPAGMGQPPQQQQMQYGGMGQEPPQVPYSMTGGETSPTGGEGTQDKDYMSMLGMPQEPDKQAEYLVHSAIDIGTAAGMTPEQIGQQVEGVTGAVDLSALPMSMGADAPQSVAEVAAALAAPTPAPDDNSPDAQAARRRRTTAANMLATLSVGLGQMSAGSPVDLSGVLNNQANRMVEQEKAEAEQQRAATAQQQQRQAAQSLSQQFRSAGQPDLANLAMQGPEGYAAAMDEAGNVFTAGGAGKDYNPEQAYYNMTPEVQAARLRGAGAGEDELPTLMGSPEVGYDFLKRFNDRTAARDAAATETATAEARSAPLLDAAVGILARGDNPDLQAAAEAVAADPQDQAAASFLRAALGKAGVDMPAPMSAGMLGAYTKHSGLAANDPLVVAAAGGNTEAQKLLVDIAKERAKSLADRGGENDADAADVATANTGIAVAAIEAGILSPELGEVAATSGLDVALKQQEQALETASVGRVSASLAASLPNAPPALMEVQTQDQLDTVMRSYLETNPQLPSEIRTAEYMLANPEVGAALIRSKAAMSGKTLSATDQAMFDDTMLQYTAQSAKSAAARPLVASMKLVNELVTAIGYDSGPITGQYLAPIQRMATDLFGDAAAGLIVDGNTLMTLRNVQAAAGEHFGAFRATGSGATSDMESRLFLSAMPGIADSGLEQAGLSQAIIRQAELNERSVSLRQQWITEKADKVGLQTDTAEMNAWVDASLQEQGVFDPFPAIDTTKPDFLDTLEANLASGNIEPTTVVKAGGTYMLARDFANKYNLDVAGLTGQEM